MIRAMGDMDAASEQTSFETQAAAVMSELRGAFLGLVEALPGGADRAVDLEKALGVSKTLGWQIHRLATSSDPVREAAQVPGAGAVRQVLRAARAAGVGEDRLERVDRAMERFESLVDQHAGDRGVFVAMVGGMAGADSRAIDLRTRRQAFRLNSQVWGVQIKTFVTCAIFQPGREASLHDMVVLRGLRDARRLRSGVPLQVSGYRLTDGSQRPTEPTALKAGEPLEAGSDPRLLGEFCSRPLPELETCVQDGVVSTFLRASPLGNTGARTIYLADLRRDLAWRGDGGGTNTHIRSATVLKPTEVVVVDSLIPRGMFGSLRPVATVFGSLNRLGETDPQAFHPDETLPVEARVYTGSGLEALATPAVPRYREMVASVLERVGWSTEDFDLYRCVVDYPVLGSTIQLRFELPATGGW